jgi:hypothetical protein
MKKLVSIICSLLTITASYGQQYNLNGAVTDTVGSPIAFATVSLLHPEDSTLAFFGITNASGMFEVKDISKGPYLLQAAFLGFVTYYKALSIPVGGNTMGSIILKPVNNMMHEVEVTAEKIPLMIKGDTIEYNSGAFKTKPDANVEELLKKLPGVQVDRQGNIKAQGEGVTKVLVDGKEFFGDDPKVATKNLPADAISKVQVFNKRSDASEFTGIDDGARERTINLMLKDGKKSGYFGDVVAGGGTDERYKFSGKLYKFRKESQFAAIGMFNNINQAGFSFQDYLSLNGGIRGLMSGGDNLRMALNGNNLPVDFGQPVNGLTQSGAGGLNYSYEPKKNRRIAVSYLGNTANKHLVQTVNTAYSIPEGYSKKDNNTENTLDAAQRLNLNGRRDVDSSNQLTLYSNVTLTNSRSSGNGISLSSLRENVLNRFENNTTAKGNGVTAKARGGYVKQMDGKWQVINASAQVDYSRDLTQSEWNNITSFLDSGFIQQNNQFRYEKRDNLSYSADASVVRSVGRGLYIEPGIAAGNNIQKLVRKQGIPPAEATLIDSLSPVFSRQYSWVRPGISLQRNRNKKQLHVGVDVEAGYLSPRLNSGALTTADYVFVLPSVEWQNEYSNSKRLGLSYNATTNTPSAGQMLPVYDNANNIQKYIGNTALKPEYSHAARLNWIWFDQFSFTSLFSNVSVRYTKDKINMSRTINNDLTQVIMPVNTPDNYNVDANVQFVKPIRKLGITFDIALHEGYERGISPVNSVQNTTDVFNHDITLTLGNRKKEKWDVQVGGKLGLSDIKYSVDKSLNNKFNNLSGFSEISYRPTDKWYFMASADVTQYNANSFAQSVVVPIIRAEISYYFLKANRGIFTLEGFDLLNRNKGIQQVGELNYFRETRSNVMGRYFMLSFKYRLNKLGTNKESLNIQIKK